MNSKTGRNRLTVFLFLFYLLFLTWVILFKMHFSIEMLQAPHGINLVPFADPARINGGVNTLEMAGNVVAFVPFGIFLSMIKSQWPFMKKVAPIAGTSLFYETAQFVLEIGVADITDFIENTFGGIIGIGIYFMILTLLKTKPRADNLFNFFAFGGTTCVIAFFLLL